MAFPPLDRTLSQSQETRKIFPQVHIAALRQLPIRRIDHDNPHDVAKQIDIISLVTEMLALHQQILASKAGHDKTAIQRRISAASKNLNRLAYALYDLTDEEIALIESTILTDND